MDREKKLEALLVITLGCIIVSLIFESNLIMILMGALILISIISHKFLDFLILLWFKFSHFLGLVNSRIILFLVYYLILLPLALLNKLFGKNIFQFKQGSITYLKERQHTFTSKDFQNTW